MKLCTKQMVGMLILAVVLETVPVCAAADNTVIALAERIAVLENQVKHVENSTSKVSLSGMVQGIFRFAGSHPVLATTVAVAAVCYSKRSRTLIRSSWGWLSSGAQLLLGEESYTVKAMHALGYAADKAEVALKEINGESSQEAVLNDLQNRLAEATKQVETVQGQLNITTKQYMELQVQCAEAKQQLVTTNADLKNVVSSLNTMQQDCLTTKCAAVQLEAKLQKEYEALQQQQEKKLVDCSKHQNDVVSAMQNQLSDLGRNIAQLQANLAAMKTELVAQITRHNDTCEHKTQVVQAKIDQYQQLLNGLEKQEQTLHKGLQKLLSQHEKTSK